MTNIVINQYFCIFIFYVCWEKPIYMYVLTRSTCKYIVIKRIVKKNIPEITNLLQYWPIDGNFWHESIRGRLP